MNWVREYTLTKNWARFPVWDAFLLMGGLSTSITFDLGFLCPKISPGSYCDWRSRPSDNLTWAQDWKDTICERTVSIYIYIIFFEYIFTFSCIYVTWQYMIVSFFMLEQCCFQSSYPPIVYYVHPVFAFVYQHPCPWHPPGPLWHGHIRGWTGNVRHNFGAWWGGVAASHLGSSIYGKVGLTNRLPELDRMLNIHNNNNNNHNNNNHNHNNNNLTIPAPSPDIHPLKKVQWLGPWIENVGFTMESTGMDERSIMEFWKTSSLAKTGFLWWLVDSNEHVGTLKMDLK